MSPDERQTMTVEEASRILGVSSRHLYEQIKRNDFPALRLGRRILISRLQLDAMLRQRRQGEPVEAI